jgi:hypothetical protein
MIVIHTKADDGADDLVARSGARSDGRDSIFNDNAMLVTEDKAVCPAINQNHQVDLMTFHD